MVSHHEIDRNFTAAFDVNVLTNTDVHMRRLVPPSSWLSLVFNEQLPAILLYDRYNMYILLFTANLNQLRTSGAPLCVWYTMYTHHSPRHQSTVHDAGKRNIQV